ncbi:MAG: hypothetical protein JNJ99_15695 [Crocinitomicaceae bacterium]|nr:hypothetical protein [Crocinitomicaceae bacterium]
MTRKLFAFILFCLIPFTNAISKDVTLKLTYKGNPLCYWDVTLKHGDVAIGQGKTDDKGFVDFGSVNLLDNRVDASGYKKTNNGEKKWDVKGYITLNDQGHADFDFEPLVQESGMASMMEVAWGLTLNDCIAGNSTSGQNTTGTTNSGTTTTNTNSNDAQTDNDSESDSDNAPVNSEMSMAESLQNQKAMYQKQIQDADKKIAKKTEERNTLNADSPEYKELSYEIKELELDKSLSQVKLEKTEKMIANGNAPLNKTDREYYKQKEDELKTQKDNLKTEKSSSNVKVDNGDSDKKEVIEDTKSGNENSKEVKENNEEKKADEGDAAEEEEEFEKFDIYTAEELALMSTFNLQKLKVEYTTKSGKRKTAIKAKGTLMKEEKKMQLENEISELEKMIVLVDAELAKRKEAE